MTKDFINDNDATTRDPRRDETDAHGQAAMMLVESLMHGLIEQSVLSVKQVIEIVDAAADVKQQIADDMGEPSATAVRSVSLLKAISQSLSHDVAHP